VLADVTDEEAQKIAETNARTMLRYPRIS
jgi:hypothetical protein